jgi:hypothetical protein
MRRRRRSTEVHTERDVDTAVPDLTVSHQLATGCRGVGRDGCERHAAHLRGLPRRTRPDAPVNRLLRSKCPCSPDKLRGLLEESRGHGGRPYVRGGEVIPDCYSARTLRIVPSPAVASGVEITLALAYDVALAFLISVADGLRSAGLRWAALRVTGADLIPVTTLPQV